MNGLVFCGACGGIGVPELGLKELDAWVVEAACVLGGGIATAQWEIETVV